MKKYIELICKEAIENNKDCKDLDFLTGRCIRIMADIEPIDLRKAIEELL